MPESPGLLLIISGPSGVGKTTIAHRVEHALDAVFSISMTTRPRSEKEKAGSDYTFVDETQFIRHRDAGDLLEWAQYLGHYYGTPRRPVDDSLADRRTVILEIDVQGAIQVKRNMPEALSIFILPPSEDVLLERLRGRRREDEQTIQRRFARAKEEIAKAKASGVYDVFIVNDDLDDAVRQTLEAIRTEQARRV